MEVIKDELRAWSPSEHCAAVIDIQRSGKVARITQTVFKRPIRRVSVILRGMRHDICEQPVCGLAKRLRGGAPPGADEDYISQAMKNLWRMSLVAEAIERKFPKWSSNYNAEGADIDPAIVDRQPSQKSD